MSKIRAVLFDLDGTLLPMDQDLFTKTYFKYLAAKLAPKGYEAKKLIDGIWQGTAAMVKNDGERSNEQVFWTAFSEIFGEKCYEDIPAFEEFYATDFNRAKAVCGFDEKSGEIVKWLKGEGLLVTLASNPVFPMIAQRSRMSWAGVDDGDFEHITSYENSRFCKPNPKYYLDVVASLGLKAEECLMVGNDVDEDMVAAESAALQVFLKTDSIINRKGRDISSYPQGDFDDLKEFIKSRI